MFGKKVRAQRRRLGLTQEELAYRTGVSVRSLSDIEMCRTVSPRQGTVRLLADAFGLAGADREGFVASALAGESEPARTATDVASPGPMRPPPAQLPADVPAFTGRSDELAKLDALLIDGGDRTAQTGTAHGERTSMAVTIAAVSGTPGVGKTALAVHWAHRIADRFPDGQLYVNLRGFDPGGHVTSPGEAMLGFLDALGVPPERIPPTPDAQVGLYRSLLVGKRILILLDNARDATQVRPLLPVTPTALAVVTSRNQLTPLLATNGANPLTIDVLTAIEARELLIHRLGVDRVSAQADAADQIITACAGLPLALAIAAARAQHSSFPLTALAAELADTRGRLDALDAGDTTTQVRAVFSWSYRALDPAAAWLFRLLGLHHGPHITSPAAASLTGHSLSEVRRHLTELVRANLLVEHLPGRYALHDLLRTYAGDLASTHDPDHTRRAAITRLLDYYTHTAHAADRLVRPTSDPIPLPLAPPAPGAHPDHPADLPQAAAWLTIEHPVLLAALRHAADSGFDTHTWQLAWALDTYLRRQGRWNDLAAAWQAALHAAHRLGDPPARAAAHGLLGRAYLELARYADAHAQLHHALELYTRTGDLVGQARVHDKLACLSDRQGHLQEALDQAQQALALYQTGNDQTGLAGALNGVGWYHALLGGNAQALTWCGQALTLFQQLGDSAGEAATWDSLGYAHHHLGHHTNALDCYRHALALYRGLGDRYTEAIVLTHLGEAHDASGNAIAARDALRQAVHILTELDHPEALDVHAKLHSLDDPALRSEEPQ